MDSRTLTLIGMLRGLNQSDFARMAGVSRQAVSLWAKQPVISLRSKNLRQLSTALGVSLDDLVQPLPILNDEKNAATLQITLLWDRLFPSLESFVIALVQGDLRAVARLVQVYGLYASAKTLRESGRESGGGSPVWKNFHQYKRYLHPARRSQCEKLWTLHESPESI